MMVYQYPIAFPGACQTRKWIIFVKIQSVLKNYFLILLLRTQRAHLGCALSARMILWSLAMQPYMTSSPSSVLMMRKICSSSPVSTLMYTMYSSPPQVPLNS